MNAPSLRWVWVVCCTLPGFGAAAQPEISRHTKLTATGSARIERIANDKIKLSLTPPMVSGVAYKLIDAAGKEVPSTVGRDGALEAVVDPKRPYILTRTAQRQALSAEGVVEFPARYVSFGPTGAVNLGGLFLRPSRVPLIWDDAAKAYAAELFVGYEFTDGSERSLPAPKTVTFFAEGSNARIEADTVVIERSGGLGYKRVRISTTELAGETLFTARAGPVDEVKSSVTVRREPKELKLALPSTELSAFGVGSGTLSVSLLARDGFPLAPEQPLEIQLSSRRLKLPSTVVLPKGQTTAQVEFRSAGYGDDAIVAQTGSLSATQRIRLIFPVAATVAALGGGALGGVARYFRNQRKQKKPLLARRLIEGILVGVIFVGAAWAGLVMVDLSTGIFGTPFGAFVLAALSGYVGCTILDRVTNRTFKNLGAEA
ncbi:MAG TPA: hypothetical protein VHO24_02900 [Opitutaceae bacterium]|nr:hypothetical protein [Opitutaceae bacterium]